MMTLRMVVIASLLVTGCPKNEPPAADKADATAKAKPTSGHCMLQDKKCWEFPNGQGMESMCSGHGPIVENQLCPTAGVVASCKSTEMRVRYYEGDRPGNCAACPDGKFPHWNKNSVADVCKASGQTME